jgi:hypothetical protein
MKKCSYCGGTGFIGTGFIEVSDSGHRVMYPHTEPCYCRVNVSIGKKYGILSPVSPAHPDDSAAIHSIYGGKDIIFYGAEDLYLYIVKCYFLTGFMYKDYIILEGGTIVEQYNVPKESKGEWLTTSHLNQYDLLALMFTSSARYTSLKDCVSEVIKNRGRLAKPTWIFAHSSKQMEESREYSSELKIYLENYDKVNLSEIKSLKGFVPRKETLAATAKKLDDKINSMLG